MLVANGGRFFCCRQINGGHDLNDSVCGKSALPKMLSNGSFIWSEVFAENVFSGDMELGPLDWGPFFPSEPRHTWDIPRKSAGGRIKLRPSLDR